MMIYAADLYCGAGGASAGLHRAAAKHGLGVNLVAVNHWDTAIETHSANYPEATHLLTEVEKVEPRVAIPGGRLDLLLAGPSCVHFSQARGGRPVSDQQRSGAWEVIHWARDLDISNILVENVPEFLSWGPVSTATGRPCKDRKGLYFRQWVRMLQDLGYTVEHRILCAAHYGDATTRRRLFIQARKGNPITWPRPTHLPPSELHAYPDAKPWVPARNIIDWRLKGTSIFRRKRPLAENTMKRILAGLEKFCGLSFVIGQQSCAAPRATDTDPLPTVATAGAISLVEPFLVILKGTSTRAIDGGARDLDLPLPTIHAGGGHAALCQPFVMVNRSHREGPEAGSTGIDEPLRTLTTGENMALIELKLEPFIVPQFNEHGPRSVDDPLNTITTQSRGIRLIHPELRPFVVQFAQSRGESGRVRDIDEPLPTVTTKVEHGVVSPFLVRYNGNPDKENRTESVDAPLSTLDTSNRLGLAEPFLVSFYGNGDALSVADPLDTVTTRDRFALIEPFLDKGDRVYVLDILFRMLTPEELAAAHSFGESYIFAGGREARVKQVGNSWPCCLSEALNDEILSQYVSDGRL